MTRETAIRRLEYHKPGTFLIRQRAVTNGVPDYALSIKYAFNYVFIVRVHGGPVYMR